jgi:chromosome segregation ATPase
MKHTDYPTLATAIARKTQLEQRLNAAQNQLLGTFGLNETIERLNREHQELKNTISGYRSAVDGGAKHYEAQLNATISQSQQVQDKLDKAKQTQTETLRLIEELTAELATCKPQATIKAILENQQAIVEKRHGLDKIRQLMDENQQAIEAANIHNDRLPGLLAQRQEWLADMALGTDRAQCLAELDKDIEETREAQAKADAHATQTIDNAQQILAGLKPRMERAQSELDGLEALGEKMLDLLVMEQARQAADDFTALSAKLVNKATELRAFQDILGSLGQRGKVGFFVDQCSLLTIPCIEGATPLEHLQGAKGAYVNAHWEHLPYAEALSQIKQGLIDQGIAL